MQLDYETQPTEKAKEQENKPTPIANAKEDTSDEEWSQKSNNNWAVSASYQHGFSAVPE
jgi:hypothetical protein